MTAYDALLKPLQIKNLTIRNRVMSTGHFPNLCEDGMPTERYQLYQAEKAKGGLGLTTFGGSSAVSRDSLSFHQVDLSTDRVLPYLEQFVERIHAEGAAFMCQYTHLGRRGRWDDQDWLPLVAPSHLMEQQHHHYAKEMEDFDFDRVTRDFVAASLRLKNSGLDGGEVIIAAHQLLDSFISPQTNIRTDEYGGSLENRMRFPMHVFTKIREAVGDDWVFGLRIAGDELMAGGMDQSDCLKVITTFANSGLIDFINVYQGSGYSWRTLQSMLPDMSYDSGAFLYLASAVKSEVDIPVFHASTIRDLATANRAVSEGHVDMVAMTRAHIADPHLVKKLIEGRADDVRQCVGANYCVDRQDGVLCIQNVSTAREKKVPHVIPKGTTRRKVIVVGGGPGGMEAARTAALRGHDVVLFEAREQLGGQIALARALSWRESIGGVPRWLEMQIRKLGVDIRTGVSATVETVVAEDPDVVIIATGGTPMPLPAKGAEHAVTSWDILSGKVQPGENVLVYDVTGSHQAATVADFISDRGSMVELVTPDQMIGQEIGRLARVHFMKRLYGRNVVMTVSHSLAEIYPEGNSLIAVLQEEHTDQQEEREVTQVVYELGTKPADELYFALKPRSSNLGEVDLDAFAEIQPQTLVRNPEGKFQLFRIGDAVISRNIHAAIYDGTRIARPI